MKNVPVLYDLAIAVEPEDINTGVFVANRPNLMAVQDNVSVFRVFETG